MFYKDWEPIYEKIANDFNFQIENDKKSAEVLNKLLKKKYLFTVKELEEMITDKEIVIFGAGPSLENSILTHKNKIINKIKISVNGATSALLKNKIFPDIIVTDLDGDVFDQIIANSNGSVIIIHAHGDNIAEIKKYVPKFKKNIIGSTQINPSQYENIHNFGGFTDGDRAVFIASHFKAKKIHLIGFDFDGRIGKYSYPINKNKKLKMKKLRWCKHLIGLLMQKNQKITYL